MQFKQVGGGYRLSSRTTKGHSYIRLLLDVAELFDIRLYDIARNLQLHENFKKGKGQPTFVIMAPVRDKLNNQPTLYQGKTRGKHE